MAFRAKCGRVNEPRNVAVYLAGKLSGLALEKIGREFVIEKYSSVSSVVTITENQLSHDQHKALQKRVEEIRRKIHKSQTKI